MKVSLTEFLLVLICCTAAAADIIHVPQDQPTIQAGIDAAVNGDVVLVSEGTYYENIRFKGKAVTVASLFWQDGDKDHITNTIIDGSQPTHPDSGSVVYFISGEDANSVIYGFTITGGTGTVYNTTQRAGGGIYCVNSGCKVMANRIINNTVSGTTAYGGGLALDNCNTGKILENKFINNYL